MVVPPGETRNVRVKIMVTPADGGEIDAEPSLYLADNGVTREYKIVIKGKIADGDPKKSDLAVPN